MRLFDRSFWWFMLIGAGNTLLSFFIMQGMYALGWGGYWQSSAFAFALTSALSFFLNKRFAFQNHDGLLGTGLRFALVIALCYLFAYSVARPLTARLLRGLLPGPVDQAAMLVGQILFTGANYLGQRFFVFAKRAKKPTDKKG